MPQQKQRDNNGRRSVERAQPLLGQQAPEISRMVRSPTTR